MQNNVRVYPGLMDSEPLQEYAWEGTVHDFFVSEGADPDAKEIQPATCYVNGQECTDWKNTIIGKRDTLEIRPNPKGDPITWAVVAVISIASAIVLRPKIPNSRNSQTQGRQLQTAETTANVAKPNQVVPELIGRHVRYPDYITPPRRYFQDKRTQYMETLLCIGPGTYDVEQVRIGNTPFSELDGTEYWIHQPGEVVQFPNNWYSAPEVGPTSGGTAGLELTAIAQDQINPNAVGVYYLNGSTIRFVDKIPDAWGSALLLNLLAQKMSRLVYIQTPTRNQHGLQIHSLLHGIKARLLQDNRCVLSVMGLMVFMKSGQ